jgi:hypothetical protein
MVEEVPDKEKLEVVVREIWTNLQECHDLMCNGFPTLWDAVWYGTFSVMFNQMVMELGEKEVGNIVGKKKLKRFIEEHEEVLSGLYFTCHREDESEVEESVIKVPKFKKSRNSSD